MSEHNISSPLRLLVTGATGFIGSRLALHAHRLGIDVLATGRAEHDIERERLEELRAAHIPFETGVLQDSNLIAKVLAGRTAVIHLAAAQHESEMPASYYHSINVDAVTKLLQGCSEARVRRFVYGSTMGVYGSSEDHLLNEDSPVRPENVYTRTKLQAEEIVRANADAFDICIIRIAETYGPGDQRLLKLFRSIDRGHFFMIGAGNNRRQCIHVNDLIRGMLLAAQHTAAIGQTFIFAGQEIMTTNEMVRHIAGVLNRKPPRLQLPLWPFIAAAGVMETALPPLKIQPPLHRRRLDFFRKSFVFSIDKARDLLGFQPEIDFRRGVLDTAQWYRAHGHLAASTTATEARGEAV